MHSIVWTVQHTLLVRTAHVFIYIYERWNFLAEMFAMPHTIAFTSEWLENYGADAKKKHRSKIELPRAKNDSHRKLTIDSNSNWYTLISFRSQVQCAGKHLDSVALRLTEVERTLQSGEDEVDNLCVMDLLESVTGVKQEYENLHKDLKEVQHLQREMATSLRYQMQTMSQTFRMLKKRLELRLEPLPPQTP